MPIYEYRCDACGKVFTKIQKFSDEPLTSHEECGSGPVEKLISAPAFHFKGTGWYVTDYGKGGSKPAESKPADTKPAAETTTTTTTSETKTPAPATS